MINFTWHSDKAEANLKKHGVSFEEARSVFYKATKKEAQHYLRCIP